MKRTLLLIWILTAAFCVQAQTRLVFEETTSEAFLIKQVTAGNSSQTNSNSIIQLLNDGSTTSGKGGRPARKPEYVVRFEQHARIADAGDVLQLKVQLQKALTTAPRPIDNARPAWANCGTRMALNTCVRTSTKMAILTGVRMSCLA